MEEPDVVLFSIISADTSCCIATLALARYLKANFRTTIVVGGEYFGYSPIYDVIDRVLSLGVIDYYISGYGEEPLGQLLMIISGQSSPDALKDIAGLCYLDGPNVRKNPFVLYHDVVPPDYEGLPIDLYKWSADCPPPLADLLIPTKELTLPFHTSTGCPYSCAFCDCSTMRRTSVMPPQTVVAELRSLVDQYGCRTFFFLDNTLNISRRYVNELCDRIIDANLDIQWMDCASAREMDAATIAKIRAAGAIRIVWGLETGSSRLLDFVKKPVDLELMSNVLRMAHEVGIWNAVEIIVGLPTETENEFEETLSFLERHADVLDEAWVNQFYLNSASEMARNPKMYGILAMHPVNRGLRRDSECGCVASFGFDEAGGYCWEDRESRVLRRMAVMIEHVAKLGLYPMTWEHEQQPNVLSWCYRQRRTKAEVDRLYRSYWDKLSLRHWRQAGWTAGSSDELVQQLRLEVEDRATSGGDFDDVWNTVYPGNYSPTFPHLYAHSLLFDGRFHDWLLYSRLKALFE
jgi:hypothetical protein